MPLAPCWAQASAQLVWLKPGTLPHKCEHVECRPKASLLAHAPAPPCAMYLWERGSGAVVSTYIHAPVPPCAMYLMSEAIKAHQSS